MLRQPFGRSSVKDTSIDHPPKRKAGITTIPLFLLTLGGIMGSGLFLASAQALRLAGPAVIFSYLLGALVMGVELTALAEMSAATPRPGSFLSYARRALGPGPAFIGGWIFWFSSVLNLGAEATAAATLFRLWFPALPLWIPAVAAAAIIALLNFLPLRGFDRVEGVMSMAKLGAVVGFIILALAALFGSLPTHGSPLLAGLRPFFPYGIRGVAAAMAVVMFSMAGTGVLGLAATAVKRPAHTIPHIILPTVATIAVTYILSALAISLFTPPTLLSAAKASPFVTALQHLPWPWLTSLLNALLFVAILSAMNAGLFATDRVLAALARLGDAPRLLKPRAHTRPVAANAVTGAALILVSALSYLLPKTAFLILVTATSFQALFIWLLIVLTEVAYRRWLRQHRPNRLSFRMPGHPWIAYLEILLILGICATAPLAPHELPSLALAVAATAAFALLYLPVRARRRAG